MVLPAIRGALGVSERVILHYDDAEDVLATLAAERMPELAARGDGDAGAPAPRRPAAGLARPRPAAPAEQIAARCGTSWPPHGPSTRRITAAMPRRASAPLDDWAKVVLAPGLG